MGDQHQYTTKQKLHNIKFRDLLVVASKAQEKRKTDE
jgi:hypothetical protein